MKVLVTGANGFVGRVVCACLREKNHTAVEALRVVHELAPSRVAVGNIDAETDWHAALTGVEVVIHLAARVHQMGEVDAAAEEAFRRVNVAGSVRLARQAAAAGVKRLVFVSSIKVNGEATYGKPYRAEDVPAPEDAYGRSKLEAEQALAAVAAETGLELVVVRPPMVIGPIAKGNLPVLLKALSRGLPLPLASVRNRRSLIGVRNLAAVLVRCSEMSQAAGEVFLVADKPALSTAQLIRHLGEGLQRRVWLWPFPVALLRCCAGLLGRRAQVDRLTQDLEIDTEKVSRLLDWQGEESIEEALRNAARGFAGEQGREKACS
jgi:nucleoside-diphosphate-sugar epimerase